LDRTYRDFAATGRYRVLSLFFMMCIKDIFQHGRNYPFPRPLICQRDNCGSRRIWSHGFIDAYFDGYGSAICLKRYICADCGCVYTIRPFGYWPRHHAPLKIIVERLCHRIRNGVWGQSAYSRQRQGHWVRALKKNIKIYLGLHFEGEVMDGFYGLLHAFRQPVIRSV